MVFPSEVFLDVVLTRIVTMISHLYGGVSGCYAQQLPPAQDCQSSFVIVQQAHWTLDLLFFQFQWRTRLHVLALIQIIEIASGIEVKFILAEDLAPLLEDIMLLTTQFCIVHEISGQITVVIEKESQPHLSQIA